MLCTLGRSGREHESAPSGGLSGHLFILAGGDRELGKSSIQQPNDAKGFVWRARQSVQQGSV